MLSLKTLTAYGFISFPIAAAFVALQVIVPTHYAEATGLSLTAIGSIILIARLCDIATDPVVGYLSDITPQRFGRRRSWVVLSIPLICISMYFLFNPPADADGAYLMLWTLAIYIVGTMAIIPMSAWGSELTSNYQQRNRISGSRTLFGLLGTLAALSIVAFWGGSGAANLEGALSSITIMVVIMLIIAGALLFAVNDNHPVELPAAQFKGALELLIKPSPLRTLLISFLSNTAANAIPATLVLFSVSYVLQAEAQAGLLLFCYFVCSALSIPVWTAIARKLGKHRTWHYSILLACSFFVWTPFLGPDDFWWYFLIVIATGFTTGCDLIIPSSMNGDLVEWDAAKSGYRRPGLFFALLGTTTKLAFALAIGLAFPLLDLLGFSAGGDNSDATLLALAWVYGLPTILFKILALWQLRNYPLTEEVYNELLQTTRESSPADKDSP